MQGIFTSDDPLVPAVDATGSNGANAVRATSAGRVDAVTGTSDGVGVRGTSVDATGVVGECTNGTGVGGVSDTGIGVFGTVYNYNVGTRFGVVGQASNAGVAAFNPDNDHAAYLASGCCAAWFTGNVAVTGRLAKGGGGFRIDHPLDPAHKFLAHSFVESPDMKNIYDGVVTADANGEATVTLPDYFDAVNHKFRYQLTAIGGPASELHVSREIEGNQFAIAGAKPMMRVSWQVTGTRHDAWAEANRIEVEASKQDKERGFYLHPELHGHGPEQSIGRLLHPHPARLGPAKPSR